MAEPKITPLARRLAEENGIDWRRLQGTGPDGTIVERDILAFLAKVMAGEVDLPPMPEEAPPLPPEEELKRVQEVLSREGVDLEDVLPETPKAPTLAVEEVAEEELDLEPALLEDLDLDLEEDLLLAEEPAREDQAPSPSGPEEEETLPPSPRRRNLRSSSFPPRRQCFPLNRRNWNWRKISSSAKPRKPLPRNPSRPWRKHPLPQNPAPGCPVPPPSPAPGLTATPGPAPFPLRVQRLRFDPGRLEAALEAFHQAHGVPHNPLPFLLKAAEKALAELELPLRPLLGQAAGKEVRGVRPMGSFLALFHQQEGEEGEGLLCFAGEEEVHSGRPSLFLYQEGVLAASGLEGPVAKKLLERVALYLENPVLLLA
ncbi:E3 binding domain-containing protein [Thermus tengchongensis]|uniref:E3 binding domain-containing protein n=1 Tax=Thermus tengchongensis TaxID=1214928 RepID=UPI000AF5C7E2|nr:E3 binding domain-containing protein [Thermus tengchongensis]